MDPDIMVIGLALCRKTCEQVLERSEGVSQPSHKKQIKAIYFEYMLKMKGCIFDNHNIKKNNSHILNFTFVKKVMLLSLPSHGKK
jgi:hypothetical protein